MKNKIGNLVSPTGMAPSMARAWDYSNENRPIILMKMTLVSLSLSSHSATSLVSYSPSFTPYPIPLTKSEEKGNSYKTY